MGKPFIAKDGRGAEVFVQTGTGSVAKIIPGDNEKSFNVSFKVDGLKHPIRGWIGAEDPVLTLAREAKEQGREVNFRTESQRKASIDPEIPIAQLRETTEIARENTISILAAIDGKLSAEAVTIPENDPVPGGRVRATPNAQAPAGPSNGGNGNGSRVPATEEPAWKQFNSDGRPNLGSYAVSGIIGAESAARSYLVDGDHVDRLYIGRADVEETVMKVTRALLKIADTVQVSVPGLVNKVDRNASSHTRARSIVYDTLKYVHFDSDNFDEWYDKVESIAIGRFRAVIDILNESLNIENQPQRPQGQGNNSAPSAPSVASIPEAEDGPAVFRVGQVDPDEPRASEDTVEALKSLVMESEVKEMSKVSRLLQWTFGTARAAEVAESALGEMVDFYTSQDEPEANFRAALDAIWAATSR